MLYNKYIIRILIFIFFLILITIINFSYLKTVFFFNKELNSGILIIFFLGIGLTLKHIIYIRKEHKWLASFFSQNVTSSNYTPILLKDVKDEIKIENDFSIEDKKAKILFEKIVSKMDFDKEVNRYLIVVLVFLGLLGTFWGLLLTIDSVGKTIGELSIEEDNILLTFLSLKESLKAPLAGMGTAFATSLFGLAASLSLGFIDLQYTKVQNDFLIYIEEVFFNLKKKGNFNIGNKSEAGEEYLLALLSQTAEGVTNLQKHLEKSEHSRRELEDLISNAVNTITKINDEINIRNNQFQKGEMVSLDHLRNIDNNIEVFKNQIKGENIAQLEELSSQITLLAKTISLIKNK